MTPPGFLTRPAAAKTRAQLTAAISLPLGTRIGSGTRKSKTENSLASRYSSLGSALTSPSPSTTGAMVTGWLHATHASGSAAWPDGALSGDS